MFRTKDKGELALVGAVFLLIFYGSFMVNVTFIHYWYNEGRLDKQYVPGKFEFKYPNPNSLFRYSTAIQGLHIVHDL